MRSSARQKDPQKVLEDMERERREMEERFTIKAGEAEKLREQEVLSEFNVEQSTAGFALSLLTTILPLQRRCSA